MKIGNLNIINPMQGNTPVQRVMHGNSLVWVRAEFEVDVTFTAGTTSVGIGRTDFDLLITHADATTETIVAGTLNPLTVVDGETIKIQGTPSAGNIFQFSNSSGNPAIYKQVASADLKNLGAITTMWGLFQFQSNLTTAAISASTNAVTDFSSLFYGNSSLTTIPASIDTSGATDITYMFNGCSSLITAANITMDSVTEAAAVFQGCSSLTSIPTLGSVASVETANNFFEGCTALTTITNTLNFAVADDLYGIFSGCTSLTQITNFICTNYLYVANELFYNCSSLTCIGTSIDLTNTVAGTRTDLFTGCTSLINPTSAEQTTLEAGGTYTHTCS